MRSYLTFGAIISFCLFALIAAQGQTLNIHSVVSARGSNGNVGYTLDGNWMWQGARAKLLNTANFGPAGTYSKTISITDGYATSGSLTQVYGLPTNDLFFFGAFDKTDPNLATFTSAEIDSLYNWSKRGGKMIICAGQLSPFQMMLYDSRVLDLKWGLFWVHTVPGYFVPTTLGNTTDIFNGPFGNCSGAYQGGTIQGYLDPLSTNSKILATNPDGKPTLVMDCNTLDLIAADVDGYTTIGNVTSNPNVLNDQDRFWVNTIAFMDQLQPLPLLNINNNTLGLNASYVDYQWYHNNQPIAGAIGANHTPTQSGNYYAEVTFNGGCKLKSDSIQVTVAVGLHEKDNEQLSALIYPNPLHTRGTLVFKQPVNHVTITLNDALGRELRSQTFSGQRVEIETGFLAKGVYFITVMDSDRLLAREKMIID